MDDQNRIHLIKVVTTHFNAPWLITSLLMIDDLPKALEHVIIDRDKKEYYYYSGNLSFGGILDARESIVYKQYDKNSNK